MRRLRERRLNLTSWCRLRRSHALVSLSAVLIVCAIYMAFSTMFLNRAFYDHDSQKLLSFEDFQAPRVPGQGNSTKAVEREDNSKGEIEMNPYQNDERMKHSIPWEKLSNGSIFSKIRLKRNPPLGEPRIFPKHLPLPIFVLNMPKSGTTTIHGFFKCGMGRHFSVHHTFEKEYMDKDKVDSVNHGVLRLPTCMAHNVVMDRPLVYGCGGFAVYTDVGAVFTDYLGEHDIVLDWNSHLSAGETALSKKERSQLPNRRQWCFFPGVHGLENIAKYYPYATILHLPRNATNWVRSSANWSKNILHRYDNYCDGFVNNTFHIPPLLEGELKDRMTWRPPRTEVNKTEREWADWYEHDYTERIRRFAMSHPTLTYFESPLEDPQTPKRLEQATGIRQSCFVHSLKTSERNKAVAKRKARKAQNKSSRKKRP